MPPVLLALFTLLCTPARSASLLDQAFMRHEIQASTYELDFARLGLVRAIGPELRAYADMVMNDHARSNEALRDLARSKDVPLTSAINRPDREQLDRLGNASDKSFDVAFLLEAQRINQDGIRGCREEARRTTDPEVRAFALRCLDVDKKHQRLAYSLSRTLQASQSPVVRPPRSGDQMVIVPAPDHNGD